MEVVRGRGRCNPCSPGAQRQLTTFKGLKHRLDLLKAWCDRILLLFNDLGRLTNTDQNKHICSQLDILIISYGSPPIDPVSYNRFKDLLKSSPAYVAAPMVSIYLQHIKRFATQHVAIVELTGQTDRPRGHFKTAFSAETLCWVCGSPNHNPRKFKMLHTILKGAPPGASYGAQASLLV